MSIHSLSRKHLLKRRLPTTREGGSLKKCSDNEGKMANDQVFFTGGRGPGLKEIEANARAVVEVRNPALL